MNKKLFLALFAVIGLLFATSCSHEELDVVQDSEMAQVTFSLGVENSVGTKAISDGSGAKKLVYAVYNANGELIKTIENTDANGQIVDNSAFDNGLTENVTITLAKGQQYTVAFWAQNPNCTAYTTTDLKHVTVDYTGLNNDETRDAFFKAETFTVTGNTEIDVTLRRPFAQINVGVTQEDWDAAINSEIEIENSKVTIKNAATSINLLTGEVDGEKTVEYDFAKIPQQFDTPETLDVDSDNNGDKESYIYLSMSYILANDKTSGYSKTTLESLAFTFDPKNGNNIKFNEGLNAVPVQRNWRTNIIGKILTGDVTFNITIDPIYDAEYNNGEPLGVKANNQYYATIVEAINAGATEIELAAGSWEMPTDNVSLQNKTLTIKGSKEAIIDVSKVDERNQFVTGAILKFEGVTLNFGTAIYMGFANYASLTYKDCTINGLQFAYGSGQTVFENCDLNSNGAEHCLWTWGGHNISFTDCDFTYGDRAVNCYGEGVTTKVSFTNCTFTKVAGKSTTGAIETNSSTLTALYLTINNCTVNEGDLWWISSYDSKNGDNTFATVDGKIASNAAMNAAIKDGVTKIELPEGTYTIPAEAKNKTLTISGTEDTKINITSGLTYVNEANITFEGVTIQSVPTGAGYTNGFADLKYATFNNCVIDGTIGLDFTCEFNGCEFNVEGNYYNVWTWGAGTATFNECTFNCDGKALLVYANTLDNGSTHQTVNITDCIFNDNGDDTVTGKAAIEITNTYTPIRTYDVIINNTKVNGFTQTVPGSGDFNVAYGSVDNGDIGTNVWGNKCKLSNTQLNVVIDNVDVY